MKRIRVQIRDVEDLANIIGNAENVPEPGVRVYKDSIVVDGTSIIGLFSLDVSAPIEIEYPEDAIEFDNFIQKLKIEN